MGLHGDKIVAKLKEFHQWIEDTIPKSPDAVLGNCEHFSRLMVSHFPELVLKKGVYHCPIWGERCHWWVSYEGVILDPTRHQFPSKGIGEYVESEGKNTVIGKCANCGSLCYEGAPSSMFCQASCERDFAASI